MITLSQSERLYEILSAAEAHRRRVEQLMAEAAQLHAATFHAAHETGALGSNPNSEITETPEEKADRLAADKAEADANLKKISRRFLGAGNGR